MKIEVGASNILRTLGRNEKKLSNTLEQISTGLANPNLASNPLASTTSRSLTQDISSSNRVQNLVSQATDVIEIAWNALRQDTAILSEMRSLAVQASNGTYTTGDRTDAMNPLFQQKIAMIDSNANTIWGDRTLFDGTFSMNVQTETFTSDAYLVGSRVTSALNPGDLTVNGVDVGGVAGNATDIATAINAQTPTTNVFASATNSVRGSGAYTGIPVTNAQIIINGVNVVIGQILGTESAAEVVNRVSTAIKANQNLLDAGISASNVAGYLQLTASDGRNLTVSYGGAISSNNIAGPAAGTYYGTVSLSSVNSITIAGNNPAKAGLRNQTAANRGVTAVALRDMSASKIFNSALPNLITQANAQAAITAIDEALDVVLNEISRISGYSTLFEDIDNDFDVKILELEDSLSTINDSDFAQAVTNSERLKVFQEAGMSVLKTQFNSFERVGHLVGESLRGR